MGGHIQSRVKGFFEIHQPGDHFLSHMVKKETMLGKVSAGALMVKRDGLGVKEH